VRTSKCSQQETAIATALRDVFGPRQTHVQAAMNVGLVSSYSLRVAAVEGSVSEPLGDVEFRI
jgi:hypothetical protein